MWLQGEWEGDKEEEGEAGQGEIGGHEGGGGEEKRAGGGWAGVLEML